MANRPEKAIRKYRRLFRRYEPKNQERIEEFRTFIELSDKYHKNFGGKKNLYKLIPLVAPYRDSYKKLYALCKKYGIDSTEVKQKVTEWKKNLNKRLIDSFSIAFIRDQEVRTTESLNIEQMRKIDNKNAGLLKWTFENYGYPSMQKIGLFNDNYDVFMPMEVLLLHMAQTEDYPYLRDKLLEYVKSGDCPPRYYAALVDRHNIFASHEPVLYGYYMVYETPIDTLRFNKNRKTLGLPSWKHANLLFQDFFQKRNK
jgi:hypothetical protein